MKQITSRRNEQIQAVCRLHRKSERASRGCFLVEGIKCVQMALQAEWDIEEVYLEESAIETDAGRHLASQAEAVPLYVVPEPVMRKISTTDTPCPVVAVVRNRPCSLEQQSIDKEGLYVIAQSTSDPGNLGSLLRVAAAAGASALFLTGDACDLTNPKVVRSSMGALFYLPVIIEKNGLALLKHLKQNGIRIVAAEPQARLSYVDCNLSGGLALLLGEESHGLEKEMLEATDEQVKIPMSEQVESLNVAVSGGILLFEARRQRSGKV